MAKATGYTCDRCSKFIVGEALPKGWLVLRVDVDPKLGGGNGAAGFELCSNLCLAELAIERAEADGTPVRKSKAKTGQRYTEAGLEAARRNGRHSAHLRGHVSKAIVNPDKTMEAINTNDYRVGDDLAWDATYTERWRWHFTTKTERCEEFDAATGECCGLCEVDGDYSIEPSGTWDEEFDYRALIEWCIKTNADLWDYLPRIYEVYEVEVGA